MAAQIRLQNTAVKTFKNDETKTTIQSTKF